MKKFFLLLLMASTAFAQWGPTPESFRATYGFTRRGDGALSQGALLNWKPVADVDGYIVSWTNHAEPQRPEVWADIAFTWLPEFSDLAPRPKDRANYYRVRSVRWNSTGHTGWPTEFQTPYLAVVFPTFTAPRTTDFGLQMWGLEFPAMRTVTGASSTERTAKLEAAWDIRGPWETYTGTEPPIRNRFFRVVIQ